ncbi:MAG: hypothetical protein DBY40_03585, partial [Clostridiales bacterium]
APEKQNAFPAPPFFGLSEVVLRIAGCVRLPVAVVRILPPFLQGGAGLGGAGGVRREEKRADRPSVGGERLSVRAWAA